MSSMNIELVYARDSTHQIRYELSVPALCTIEQAIEISDILVKCPELETPYMVGIWYKAAHLSDTLKAGDRIEIYRPLHLSAMDARKARDARKKSNKVD